MGILERGGEVRATVVPNRKSKVLFKSEVRNHVEAGARSIPMRCMSYEGLDSRITRTRLLTMPSGTLTGRFTPTDSKTSGVLLKRGLKGTYA